MRLAVGRSATDSGPACSDRASPSNPKNRLKACASSSPRLERCWAAQSPGAAVLPQPVEILARVRAPGAHGPPYDPARAAGASWSGFGVFAQAGVNHQRRGVGPAGGGWHVNLRTDIEREMPRRIQREGGTGKAMGLVVVGAGSKPARQNAEIGRAIAAAAPPFVERRDGGQKLGNGRSCPRSQQL